MIEIKAYFGENEILYCSESAQTIKQAVEDASKTKAYLTGADLRGADLTGADLTGARLRGADLTGADLRGADLTGADLTGARLRGADLTGARLRGADLTGAKINWLSHCLISHILYRAALEEKVPVTQLEKRKVTGLIAISTDWCWNEFLELDEPLRDWALETLASYAKDDENAPKCFKSRSYEVTK